MDDKIIASFEEPDGSTEHYFPHNNRSKSAEWDSSSGLTISSDGRNRFFPEHRVLEINEFSDPETYIWYSIKNDPVIDQFYDRDKKKLYDKLMQMGEELESDDYDRIRQWIEEETDFRDEVKGSLARIARTADLLDEGIEEEVSNKGSKPVEA